MAKIGFIGMGNMGYAMLKGALAAFYLSIIITIYLILFHIY